MEVVITEHEADRVGPVADRIEALLAANPAAVLGLATGSSPLPLYTELIARHRAGRISFAQATAFTLDEYVGLPDEHPERYRHVIERELTSHIDIDPARVHGPDGNAADPSGLRAPGSCATTSDLPSTITC